MPSFSAFRIIDANANRAAEGLRVMEDLARFALNHEALAAAFKHGRHDLQSVLAAIPGGQLALLASRDTPGDVGTQIKAEGTETTRTSLNALAAAAGGRTTQALRAIEEALKFAAPGDSSSRIELIRYRTYEAEKKLSLALGTGRAPQWRLCVLITESLCKRPWLDVARAAIEGGADCIQLREKNTPDAELITRAKSLVAQASRLCIGGSAGTGHAAIIINDRPDIALLAGAHGVHLGQEDAPIASVRQLAGDRLLIGISTHDLTEARRALHEGADYAGVGAMFPTSTKARDTSGPEYLAAFLELTKETRPLPHLAIGGITPANISALIAAGCRGVAVSGVVCGSDDPAGVCRKLRIALGE